MQGAYICSNCGVRTIQAGETACAGCRLRQSQPEPILSPISVRICAVCGQSEACYICICAFPLVDLCSTCTQKHVSTFSAVPHCVQPKSTGEFINSAEDYQRHIDRIDRIQGATGRLKAWTLATVEQAKVNLGEAVKRLHWTLDEQHKGWLEMMRKTEEKVSALEAVLEEMKADYCLRSGTFVDLWVERRREDLLQSLGNLVVYQVREEVCDFANLLLYQDNVPVAAPDRSNVPIVERSQVFSSSISLFSPRVSAFPAKSSSQAVQLEPQIPAFQSLQPTFQPSNVCPDPTPTPSLCSYCQKYQLPNISQYSPADQVSICNCSAASNPCAICQRPVFDQSWTSQVGSDLWRFRESCKMVCSMACFGQICRLATTSERPKRDSNSHQMCISCREAIGTNNITMQCGHQFHDIRCFYAFLKLKSNNFHKSANYCCGICQRKIDFEVLDTFFGYANHMKTISINQAVVCAVCRNYIAVLTTPCNHPICTNCAKKGNASCHICGMDSRCLLA